MVSNLSLMRLRGVTFRDSPKNREFGFLGAVGGNIPVDKPADQDIKQNDKDGPECRDEEECFLLAWKSLGG